MDQLHHRASFRDPAAYVYSDGGRVKRAVTSRGLADYRRLVDSGLAAELHDAGLLIPHDEEAPSPAWPADAAAVLVPEVVPFVSYPYEWSFGQLRDAALLTLDVQERAMARGLSLKDASAFNVQFRGSVPVFIDTLSFYANTPGPWVAYHQFCRHFLAPLLMMRHAWPGAARMLRVDLDGLDLDWVSRTLPVSTYLRFGVLLHVHLHARALRKAGVVTATPPSVAAAPGAAIRSRRSSRRCGPRCRRYSRRPGAVSGRTTTTRSITTPRMRSRRRSAPSPVRWIACVRGSSTISGPIPASTPDSPRPAAPTP